MFFQSMHHVLLLGTTSKAIYYLSGALLILQVILMCYITEGIQGKCPKFEDGDALWFVGVSFCTLYGAASVSQDFSSTMSVITFVANKAGVTEHSKFKNSLHFFVLLIIDVGAASAMSVIMARSENLRDIIAMNSSTLWIVETGIVILVYLPHCYSS